ncbi:MAG: 50S ribosomal protein L9 [Coriobacteriia bacterium]|nr:50S ribosomal protein L9 [Coriobacteriia bacterium]
MKVILMQELKGRGGEGDVIDVARGFAVNYLLPRKIAIEATPGNVKQLQQRLHNIGKREDQRLGDAGSLAAALDGKTVTIAAKVGEEGRLFGSVTAPMVHEAILEQLGVDIDRRKIETHGHIKDMGPHVVDISIYREVKAQVTVDVVAEGAVAEAVAPEVKSVEMTDATEGDEADADMGEAVEAPAEFEEAEAEDEAQDADSEVDSVK